MPNHAHSEPAGCCDFELPHVFLLNITHQLASVREVAFQSSGHLDWHDRYLIVRRFAKGNWATGRNQMRAPLEDESEIPQNQEDCDGLSDEPSSLLVPNAR